MVLERHDFKSDGTDPLSGAILSYPMVMLQLVEIYRVRANVTNCQDFSGLIGVNFSH